jgi:DNA-binding response OmpR family regulator
MKVEQNPVILAVDDDPTARILISSALSALSDQVYVTESCREFRDLTTALASDLFIIDVELPDGDGFDLAQSVRRETESPIIFFTVHGDQDNRFRGLELGAIDYLSKPVHPRELSLRVRNLLSIVRPPQSHGASIAGPCRAEAAGTIRNLGGLAFDLARRTVAREDGETLRLTASEFEVMALLTEQPQRVVSREEIADRLGPRSAARHNARIVDVLIWRLRKKLEAFCGGGQIIATVPLRGYVLTEVVTPG